MSSVEESMSPGLWGKGVLWSLHRVPREEWPQHNGYLSFASKKIKAESHAANKIVLFNSVIRDRQMMMTNDLSSSLFLNQMNSFWNYPGELWGSVFM